MADNHAEFAKQVLRGIAHLWKNHPRLGTLSNDNILKTPAKNREEVEAACGTVMWLYRNGIVSGIVEEGTQPFLRSAQLTSAAYLQGLADCHVRSLIVHHTKLTQPTRWGKSSC